MQEIAHLVMRFSMQCKLIVEDATLKEAQNMETDDDAQEIPQIPNNIFREINDIKEEFSVLSKLIFKILNKRKGVDNS
eukprot:CAMPEP_0205829584 /NCGR_PEP_ID=MMETSP0206-20130828/38603_1 /ASSEMBLY_ACC=CAM_ASM_000279 /TAXON_ID=36767 /ORGANISM="Euplotes focardii, Strain TN1" /LENGTH=77 /DNA_ID=CAMNT_0053132439 /DNA_START=178 /DNA_END=408 /DNA_ORIENTATION=-